jgi:hypothetical protein
MTTTFSLVRLTEFQTTELMKLQSRGVDTYITPLLIEGNSILSSIYVKSMDVGASIIARYYDYTTGVSTATERYFLIDHPTILPAMLDPTYGLTDRKTVTRIHNKPVLEVQVIGGNVEFGVYATVVTSFASDLDSALQFDGEIADLTRDKGMPIVTLDDTSGEFNIVRSTNGRMQVDVPGGIQTVDTTINKRLYSQDLAAVPAASATVITYTVPVGKKFYFLSGYGSSNCDCEWRVFIDGNAYLTRRNYHTKPDVELTLQSPIILVAGQILTVDTMNRSVWGSNSEIETFIYGSEQNI